MADSWLFDALLAAVLPFLAWRLLTHPDLFKAVVLFIVFGLLLSLVWVRLQAPDVALAEAAIGAGLTGALLLNALGHMQALRLPPEPGVATKMEQLLTHAPPERRRRLVLTRGLLAALSGAIGIMLLQIVLDLPLRSPGLTAEVHDRIPRSGVTNPVTAVLLNFRGYDTMLEIAVLLLAVFGVWSLTLSPVSFSSSSRSTLPGPVLIGLVHVLPPLILLVAAYLLWLGAFAPGGAFQGGAILAAGGLLLLLSNTVTIDQIDRRLWRFVLVGGFSVFLLVAVGVLPFTGHLLAYPAGQAGGLILLIEATLTVSIACILVTLFTGGPSR